MTAPTTPAGTSGDKPTIDLDQAATTTLRPEAREEMLEWLGPRHGNPSGAHSLARAARRAVDVARQQVAASVGARPGEIVFTSGGTESDNLAITGAVLSALRRSVSSPLVACSAVEHSAVRSPVRVAGGSELPVDGDGVVDLAALDAFLAREAGERLALVSVMLVNNETGVVQPVAEVADLVRRRSPSTLVHCDAVQGFVWLDAAEALAPADLVSISAHKFQGPQGVGALVVREGARRRLLAVSSGGPQERELRPGTHNVAGCVGMGVAAELAARERRASVARVELLADRFVALLREGAACVEAVPRARRVGAICNLRVPGVVSEELLLTLDEAGVCASAGSSCASGATEPSQVLSAMGVPPDVAK
ncbi:MAG: cysteine desulfurase family protein, partial [Acidimicrobiales bacterium]